MITFAILLVICFVLGLIMYPQLPKEDQSCTTLFLTLTVGTFFGAVSLYIPLVICWYLAFGGLQ